MIVVDVTFAKRGFPAEQSAVTEHLEAVPQAVICGFEWGIGARNQWEVERRLAMVDPELRGFAYEGVTMAFTIRDSMAVSSSSPRRPMMLLTRSLANRRMRSSSSER